MTQDNHLLGIFKLEGITLAPKGVPQIEITFDVNPYGILSVSAIDKNGGNTQTLVVNRDDYPTYKYCKMLYQEEEIYKEKDEQLYLLDSIINE